LTDDIFDLAFLFDGAGLREFKGFELPKVFQLLNINSLL
jgi:hypothetical protein